VPGAKAQLTLLTATCPPKRMVRSLVSSIVGHAKRKGVDLDRPQQVPIT
jgi:cytosine/adenosine deaminase-related metal-dependent hydrolase